MTAPDSTMGVRKECVLLSVFVPGVPVPQGSMKAFHRPGMRFAVVTADNKKTKPWRLDVAAAAHGCRAGYAEVGQAVFVAVTFLMPRTKGDFGKKGLKPSAPAQHTKKPDCDKLVRAILDALTGVVFADDSQVVSVTAVKRYVLAGEVPGCHVLVTQPT